MPQSEPLPLNPPSTGGADFGLVDALAQLSFSVHGILGRIAAGHDVSMAQTRLLGILRDRHPTIKELAGFLQVDKSSVTGLVDRAEERGLVERVSSTVDRRSVQVIITPAGRVLVDRVTAEFETEITHLATDLTPNQQARLSTAASLIVVADARRRGVDLLQLGSPIIDRSELGHAG